jgi:hypothetical protein
MAKKARGFGQDPRQKAMETAAAGLAVMLHPERVSCSFAGREYKPDVDGVVLVPVEAVSQLSAHGFSPVEEAAVPASIEGTSSSFDKFEDL